MTWHYNYVKPLGQVALILLVTRWLLQLSLNPSKGWGKGGGWLGRKIRFLNSKNKNIFYRMPRKQLLSLHSTDSTSDHPCIQQIRGSTQSELLAKNKMHPHVTDILSSRTKSSSLSEDERSSCELVTNSVCHHYCFHNNLISVYPFH